MIRKNMSADNYTMCPKCVKNQEVELELNQQLLQDNYGKINREEYQKLVSSTSVKKELKETLREDYEIGIYGDEFFYSYSASCSVCNYGFHKEHTEKLDLAGK